MALIACATDIIYLPVNFALGIRDGKGMFYNAHGLQAGIQDVLCKTAKSQDTVTLRQRTKGRTVGWKISQSRDARDLIQETNENGNWSRTNKTKCKWNDLQATAFLYS